MLKFKEELNLALFEGRHEIPQATDGSIFRGTIDSSTMKDEVMLEELAFSGIWNAAYRHHKQYESGFLFPSVNWDGEDAEPLQLDPDLKINIYVTGLTVALIAALNVCRHEGLKVTLYHYDKESGEYFSQEVR